MTRRSPRGRAVEIGQVAVVGAVLTWLLIASVLSVGATDERRGTTIRIATGQMIMDDLQIVAGRAAVLDGVAGNLSAATGYLNIVGPVAGTVEAVGGRVEIRGAIGESVVVGGGSVAIYGRVAGDVVVAGGTITIVEEAAIAGNLILRGGGSALVVDGATIGGDIRGTALRLTIEGRVEGDVRITARRLSLVAPAHIGGNLRYEGRAAPAIGVGATIDGVITHVDPAHRLPFGEFWFWRGAAIPRFLVMLASGAIILLFVPHRLVRLTEPIRVSPTTTIALGVGVVVFAPLVLLVLGLFVVTLPLVIVGAVLYGLSVYLSQVVLGLAFGRMVLRITGGERRRAVNLLAMALGITALSALRVIPVPYIGTIVAIATAMVGVGAIVASGGQRRQHTSDVTGGATSSSGQMGALMVPIAGYVVGFILISLAIIAVVIGLLGALAAVLTVSNQASFLWTVTPERLALIALACGLVTLGGMLLLVIKLRC